MPSKCTGYRPGIPQQPYTKWDTDKDEVEVDYKSLEDKHGSWFSGRKGHVLRILIILVVFSLGLIIGYVIRRSVHELIIARGKCPYTNGYEGYSTATSDELRLFLDPSSIEDNLRNYTSKPHQAGVHNNNQLGEVLKQQMLDLNLKVKTPSYNVLLSYPDYNDENTVSLLDELGTVQYETAYRGPHMPMDPEFAAYMAFSPNGTFEGELVYANFGSLDDFNVLQQKGVTCVDSVVIMRYGRVGIHEKLTNAAACGSTAVIFYTDPSQVKDMHTKPEDLFPESWWLPGWAVRRATILRFPGDPLTPDLPAAEGMYRLDESDVELPMMLVQSIGYDDAHQLMMFMKGPLGPTSFIGGMHMNVSYKIGPGYLGDRQDWKVRIALHNERESRQITNIIGVIDGHEEPDRYVIVGCHYDAWLYGGVDPNSGTAVLMELAKAFTNLTQKGWSPRRSIIFAHWDAGEQGQQGSYEWVQENLMELTDGAVTYINLDAAVTGHFSLVAQATPPLRALILEIARYLKPAVPALEMGFDSLFDEWMVRNPDPSDKNLPRVSKMTYDSDQAPFIYELGVPALWPRYSFDDIGMGMNTYPGYHTAVDNFTYVSNFIDPGFHAHHRLAELVGELLLQLSSHTKLPLDLREYAHALGNGYDQLQATFLKDGTFHKLDYLEWAVGNFSQAANQFMDDFHRIDITDVLELRRKNDKFIRVARAFIHPHGLPNQPHIKNILFAPSATDFYQDSTFTGIRDALSIVSEDQTHENQKELQMQISIAILAIQSATNILSDSIIT